MRVWKAEIVNQSSVNERVACGMDVRVKTKNERSARVKYFGRIPSCAKNRIGNAERACTHADLALSCA